MDSARTARNACLLVQQLSTRGSGYWPAPERGSRRHRTQQKSDARNAQEPLAAGSAISLVGTSRQHHARALDDFWIVILAIGSKGLAGRLLRVAYISVWWHRKEISGCSRSDSKSVWSFRLAQSNVSHFCCFDRNS